MGCVIRIITGILGIDQRFRIESEWLDPKSSKKPDRAVSFAVLLATLIVLVENSGLARAYVFPQIIPIGSTRGYGIHDKGMAVGGGAGFFPNTDRLRMEVILAEVGYRKSRGTKVCLS